MQNFLNDICDVWAAYEGIQHEYNFNYSYVYLRKTIVYKNYIQTPLW